MNPDIPRPDSHDQVLALLPWWINGSLTDTDVAHVEQHLRECGDCRREADVERRLYSVIRHDASCVDHAPQASFEKLWSRIEELDRDVPRGSAAHDTVGGTGPRPGVSGPQRWLLAASVVLAFGAGLVATSLWNPASPGTAPGFRTATATPPAASAAPTVRAVFDPATSVEELTRILRETRLTVVAGPSESGVCTLALDPDGTHSVEAVLDRLRADPRVRFAEPVPRDGSPSDR